jgi:hypothetical protein
LAQKAENNDFLGFFLKKQSQQSPTYWDKNAKCVLKKWAKNC